MLKGKEESNVMQRTLTEAANHTLVPTTSTPEELLIWGNCCRVPKMSASVLVGLRSGAFWRNHWDTSSVQLYSLDTLYELRTSNR